MKLKSRAFASALFLLTSIGASAQECPPGFTRLTVDKVTKCVPDASVVVIIDPEWLVGGVILLLLIFIAIAYLAIKVGQLANRLESGRRIG